MTPLEAAGLAILAMRDRRLVATLLRLLTDRATADDCEALPPRTSGETLLEWACRCRCPRKQPFWPPDAGRLVQEAERQLQRAERLGVTAVCVTDAGYPRQLAAIADPPPLLWSRGQLDALSQPAVAIVGSRAATPYALMVARQLAVDLAAAGLVIVSGLARGIDSVAHRAVVGAQGSTIGVLGCGVDRIYPPEHAELAHDMEVAGAVVSELPLGTAPRPYHFPLRNRIISGLSLAIVVVEAPERSGALITASAAAEQGRDVMVVPGPTTGGRNRGGHLLIRDGAKVVETADDILQEVQGIATTATAIPVESPTLPDAPDFTVDDVAATTGELPSTVLARLLDLELAGRIQRVGGGRFVRVLT